jgi:hypothetical protein
MEHKSIKIQFKEAQEGAFTAQIATLNVVDSDGDLTRPAPSHRQGTAHLGLSARLLAGRSTCWQSRHQRDRRCRDCRGPVQPQLRFWARAL